MLKLYCIIYNIITRDEYYAINVTKYNGICVNCLSCKIVFSIKIRIVVTIAPHIYIRFNEKRVFVSRFFTVGSATLAKKSRD